MVAKKMVCMKVVLAAGLSMLIAGEFVFAHEWMAPREAAMLEKTVSCGVESQDRGQVLYQENCATCHGGSGEGLAASETGLGKDTPHLTKRLATHSDGDFYWKIRTGRGEMPSFVGDLEDEEVWDIINFIGCPKE